MAFVFVYHATMFTFLPVIKAKGLIAKAEDRKTAIDEYYKDIGQDRPMTVGLGATARKMGIRKPTEDDPKYLFCGDWCKACTVATNPSFLGGAGPVAMLRLLVNESQIAKTNSSEFSISANIIPNLIDLFTLQSSMRPIVNCNVPGMAYDFSQFDVDDEDFAESQLPGFPNQPSAGVTSPDLP